MIHVLPYRLSSRTVVTQDDPLGALNDDEAEEEGPTEEDQEDRDRTNGDAVEGSTTMLNESDKKQMYSDQPILFRGHRSQTFDESIGNVSKSMHRSETMPTNSVASSLASSIKFFG